LQLLKCPFWGWRSALPLLALLLTGGAFALSTSSAGRADDPPPTTVSTPTLPAPVPAPDPSPRVVKPRQKSPTPKNTPRKTPRAPIKVAPVASAPAATPSVVSDPVKVQPKKPKTRAHKVHRKAAARHPQTAPAVKLAPQRTLGASLGFRNQAGPKSTSSFDVSSLVLILGLAIATACFSFALIPARALPWHQVATFRSERQVDMTLIGVGVLAIVLMLYLMTRA
jgi:hypothetical protein